MSAVALTLWPQWAWAVHALDKRVENRTWPLPPKMIGQRVYLHAGAASTEETHGWRALAVMQMAQRAGWSGRPSPDGFEPPILTRGAVNVAVPRRRAVPCSALLGIMRFTACDPPGAGDLTGWRAPDQFGWCFEFEPLARPVLCSGALGFWKIPADLEIP